MPNKKGALGGFLGKTAVARKLGVDPKTLTRLIDSGEFPQGKRLLRRYYWCADHVDRWLEAMRQNR
jgi:predicted DNA-binding transcriptional regulator AlpA